MKYPALTLLLILTGCVFFSVDITPKDEYEEKFVSGDEDSANKILLVPIEGLIMSRESTGGIIRSDVCSPEQINELLHKSAKDKSVKAIILSINSPGGGVTTSDIIYKTIKDFRAKYPDKPIIALFKDTAASGAYYIAMASNYIVAHPTSITGSIGVISMFITIEDLMGKIGVEAVIIKSGKSKDVGSPFRKMTADEKEFMQKIINEMYERFVDTVANGRQNALSRDEIKAIADGRILTGAEAQRLKLVDAVGYLDDAANKARELAHLKDARVIRYHKKEGVLETAFRMNQSGGDLAALSSLLLPGLQSAGQFSSTRFMYLWMPSLEK